MGTPFRQRNASRAFTLIELMVVVTIIGVLAVLAVVGFRAMIRAARTSEATEMVNAIKVAQETFHAETGQYANVSKDLNKGSLYPLATPNSSPMVKTVWGAACTQCTDSNAWKKLPVHASGAMYFGYATVAGAAGAAMPTATDTVYQMGAGLTSDWFVARGMLDQNSNGIWCSVFASSWTNQVYVENDGE